MADKFVTLHPSKDGVLDDSINIYPHVKASGCILDDENTPIEVQEKLVSGENIRPIQVGSSEATPESLLGSNPIIIDFLNKMYPVGTIYTCSTRANVRKDTSDNPICPIQDLLGGVWQPIYDTFLYAAAKGTHVTGTTDYFPGDSGGSKDAVVVEHTHTTVASGAHSHTVTGITGNTSGNIVFRNQSQQPIIMGYNGIAHTVTEYGGKYWTLGVGDERQTYTTLVIDISQHSHTIDTAPTHTHTIQKPEGSVIGTGMNMPPYLAVYAWERIS